MNKSKYSVYQERSNICLSHQAMSETFKVFINEKGKGVNSTDKYLYKYEITPNLVIPREDGDTIIFTLRIYDCILGSMHCYTIERLSTPPHNPNCTVVASLPAMGKNEFNLIGYDFTLPGFLDERIRHPRGDSWVEYSLSDREPIVILGNLVYRFGIEDDNSEIRSIILMQPKHKVAENKAGDVLIEIYQYTPEF